MVTRVESIWQQRLVNMVVSMALPLVSMATPVGQYGDAYWAIWRYPLFSMATPIGQYGDAHSNTAMHIAPGIGQQQHLLVNMAMPTGQYSGTNWSI